MNFNEYQKLVLRTESVPKLELAWTNEAGDLDEHYNLFLVRALHATMGFVTEVAEYANSTDAVNSAEELGDITWYLAIAMDALPKDLQPSMGKGRIPGCRTLMGDVTDILKRAIFYGTPFQFDKFVGLLGDLWCYVFEEAASCQLTLEQIFEANIKKLEKRYPNLKFDAVATTNRNVKNELSHIEEVVAKPTQVTDLVEKEQMHLEPSAHQELQDMEEASKTWNRLAFVDPFDQPLGEQVIYYPKFKELFLALSQLKQTGLVGEHYLQLSEYYRKQGCNNLADAFKLGYGKAIVNPDPVDAWATLHLWNSIAGLAFTEKTITQILNDPRSICLCKLSARS